MTPTGSRALVTGGHGFIGRHLVAALVESGTTVLAPRRPGETPNADDPNTSFVLDVRNVDGLTEAMSDVDVVYHLAARSGGVQFQTAGHADVLLDNALMTAGVLEAAEQAGVRRVFLASSAVVYGGTEPIAMPESAALLTAADNPSAYAWSKLTDEAMGGWWQNAGNIEVVIGRFSNVYGPGATTDPTRSTVVHAIIRRIIDAPPGGEVEIWGDGRAVRSFVYVTDAVRAAVLATQSGEPGDVFNVDSGEGLPIAELACRIRDLVDPAVRLRFDPGRPSGVPHRVLDVAKLTSLGFSHHVNLTDGLTRTIAWAGSS